MKKIILSVVVLLVSFSLNAQDFESFIKEQKKKMQHYADSVQQDYFQFRQKANEDYARFMRERWEEFQSMKGEPMPEIPEPPQPYEREKDQPIPELPIKYGKLIPIPDHMPIGPKKHPDTPQIPITPLVPEFNFTCYGTSCSVHLDNGLKFKLKDSSENTVADSWEHLSSETMELLLEDCLNLRTDLALGDWAYYCLLRDLSETYFGKNTNEAVLFQTYLMVQSGYKLRIARTDDRLVLMLPFDGVIYEKAYILLEGAKFYIMDRNQESGYYVFNHSFTDNDGVLSLRMPCVPKFAFKPSSNKTFTSKRYPDLTVTMAQNQNLMDFYNGYPKCLWTNYSWAGLSEEVKAKLYPVLRKGIEGKSQIEAANRLINFVQTAFEYKTDGQQFGYERSLFADETFFYPYSDCEDRSILFSILVQDLLGLEVVLLHYPDHLATAVHYTEYLDGAYFNMEGKPFYISDPTYIGAKVGECMPRYIKTNPEVLKLK